MDELNRWRQKIETIDQNLIGLLSVRLHTAERIGEWKKGQGKPAHDPVRQKAVKADWRKLAEECHLSPDFAEKVYDLIHEEALRLEQ